MPDQDFTSWQDRVAVLTLKNGESTTAHILYVDSVYKELIVDVLDSNRTYPNSDSRAFAIPFGRVISILSAPAGICKRRPAQPPETCRARPSFSPPRFALFTLVFLIMFPVSLGLYLLLADKDYGIQFASAVSYTAAIVLYTFSSNRGAQRFLFQCPVIHSQLSRLALRHIAFLIVLLVIETTALRSRPRMPASWLIASGRNMSPFATALLIFGGVLVVTEVSVSRSLLRDAHLNYNCD